MVNDSIGDSINRIKHGYQLRGRIVGVLRSKFVSLVLKSLFHEGYVGHFVEYHYCSRVYLRYHFGRPACRVLWRISKPGRRVYLNSRGLKRLALQGVSVFFTSSFGIFLNYRLFVLPVKIGGEVLFGVK